MEAKRGASQNALHLIAANNGRVPMMGACASVMSAVGLPVCVAQPKPLMKGRVCVRLCACLCVCVCVCHLQMYCPALMGETWYIQSDINTFNNIAMYKYFSRPQIRSVKMSHQRLNNAVIEDKDISRLSRSPAQLVPARLTNGTWGGDGGKGASVEFKTFR